MGKRNSHALIYTTHTTHLGRRKLIAKTTLQTTVPDVHDKCHRNKQANIFRGGRQDATRSLAPHMAPQRQAEESIVEMPSTQDLLDHCQMTGSVCEQCLFHSTRPRTMPGTNQNSVSNCSGQSIASSLIMACLHHMNL